MRDFCLGCDHLVAAHQLDEEQAEAVGSCLVPGCDCERVSL